MVANGDRSLPQVLAEVAVNIQHLVRAELRLARAEVRDQLKRITRGVLYFVAAAIVGVLGLGVLLQASVYGLTNIMAPWAAALVVGGATLVIAGIAGLAGARKMRQVRLPPPRTVQTIEETWQWAKTHTK